MTKKNNITAQKAREMKAQLKHVIEEKVMAFEKETKCTVVDVKINRTFTNDMDAKKGLVERSQLIGISISVEL